MVLWEYKEMIGESQDFAEFFTSKLKLLKHNHLPKTVYSLNNFAIATLKSAALYRNN